MVNGDHRDIATVDIGADEYTGLITPTNETICASCTLINKYQPPFQWLLNGTFQTFTIYFSTSPSDFSGKGYFITKANIKGTLNTYTPPAGIWKKIMTASNNNGSIRDIYWKVVGTRGDKYKTTWASEVRHFKVDEPLPAGIQLPGDGASLPSSTPPIFEFDPNCNTKFTLEFSTLADFGDSKKIKKFNFSSKDPNTETTKTVTLSSFQWKSVVKLVGIGPVGYFRIIGTDGINRTTTSGVREFTISP